MAKYEARIEVSKGIDVSFETPLFTGDVGNSVKLLFFLRGKPYNSETAEVSAKRADGCVVSLSVVTRSNEAEFTLPNNMYPDKGALEVQIALVDGSGNVLTSGVLHFEVLEGLSGSADMAGTEQYNDMTELLSQVGVALNDAQNAVDQCSYATVGATVAEARAIHAAEAAEAVIQNIPHDYDIIIDSDTDLSQYAGQTISNKTIFFKGNQTPESSISITFSGCTIYGNNKTIGTLGILEFSNCHIYDLHVSPCVIWADETNEYNTSSGDCLFTNCCISGGSAFSYWDPNFSGCKVYHCSLQGYTPTIFVKDDIFIACNFNDASVTAMDGNTYNIFTNCTNLFSGHNPLTGQCFFSGCSGSVSVSSSATLKPSTTTAFSDINFADLTIS